MEHTPFCKAGAARYTIEGRPVPLARARHGNRRCWDAQKHLKTGIGISLRNQHGNSPQYAGPCYLEVVFFFGMPKAMSLKKKAESVGKPYLSRPDLDNLIKFVLDVATGILFEDDAIFVAINATKMYGPYEQTVFSIKPFHEVNHE